jgi:hypothetical protein
MLLLHREYNNLVITHETYPMVWPFPYTPCLAADSQMLLRDVQSTTSTQYVLEAPVIQTLNLCELASVLARADP